MTCLSVKQKRVASYYYIEYSHYNRLPPLIYCCRYIEHMLYFFYSLQPLSAQFLSSLLLVRSFILSFFSRAFSSCCLMHCSLVRTHPQPSGYFVCFFAVLLVVVTLELFPELPIALEHWIVGRMFLTKSNP